MTFDKSFWEKMSELSRYVYVVLDSQLYSV